MNLSKIIITVIASTAMCHGYSFVIQGIDSSAIENRFIEYQPFFVGDTLNGEVIKYYKSGQIMEKAYFIEGLRNGPCTIYNPNGTVNAELAYKQNQLDGLCKRYDKSGNIEREIIFTNGMFDGKFIIYNMGNKSIEANFKLGKIDGWFYDFYKNGVIHHKAFYRNGEIVSGEYSYHSDGILQYELISNKDKNRLITKVSYDKKGNRVKLQTINQLPLSYFLFGPSAHTE